MAKLLAMPEAAIVSGFKKTIDFYSYMGIPVARKWPRSPGHDRSPAVQAQWPIFTVAAQLWSTLSPEVQAAWNEMAAGTGLTGRDISTRAYISGWSVNKHIFEEEMKLIILATEVALVSIYPQTGPIAWTDIDLSAYTTSTTKFAFLRAQLGRTKNVTAGDILLYLRPKDGALAVQVHKWWTGVIPIFYICNDTFVEIGTDDKIQYKLDAPAGCQEIDVKIWLLGIGEQS